MFDLQPDELGCDLGEALAAPLRPSHFDCDGASLDPAVQEIYFRPRRFTSSRTCETMLTRAVFSEGDAARPITASQPPVRACKTSKHYRSRWQGRSCPRLLKRAFSGEAKQVSAPARAQGSQTRQSR